LKGKGVVCGEVKGTGLEGRTKGALKAPRDHERLRQNQSVAVSKSASGKRWLMRLNVRREMNKR